MDDYELIDSGDGKKLELFGAFTLVRPCTQAIWRPRKPQAMWERADASFDRTSGNRWKERGSLPEEWTIRVSGIRFRLSTTDFGHLGIFPEQRSLWRWIRTVIEKAVIQEDQPWPLPRQVRGSAMWTPQRAW